MTMLNEINDIFSLFSSYFKLVQITQNQHYVLIQADESLVSFKSVTFFSSVNQSKPQKPGFCEPTEGVVVCRALIVSQSGAASQ